MSVFSGLFQPGAIGASLGIQPFKPFEMATPGGSPQLAGLAEMAAKALPGEAGQLLAKGAQLAQSLSSAPAGNAGGLGAAAGALAAGAIPNALPGAGALGGSMPGVAGAIPGSLSQAASSLLPGQTAAVPDALARAAGALGVGGMPAAPGLPSAASKALAGQMPGADDLLSALPATGNPPLDQALTVAKALRQPG